jgi:hypothetical protein
MSSPLSFLRPLRYDRVRDVLLVQTDAGARLPGIVVKLREIFPGCAIHALVREADGDLRTTLEVESFEVARWEERFELLSRLRRRRFDAVVLQLGSGGSSELRMLPYLVRARYLIAFNDTLDYFPINVFRLTSLAHHFSLTRGEAGILRSLYWLVRGALASCVLSVAGLVVLLASVARLHVRGWWRRRRRAAAAARAGARVA